MKRPDELESWSKHLLTGYEDRYKEELILTVAELNRVPYETFIKLGDPGHLMQSLCEPIARLMTVCFQAEIPVEKVIRQLVGIGDDMPRATRYGLVKSIPDAIGQELQRRYLWRETNGK